LYEGKTAWDIMRISKSTGVKNLVEDYLYLINNKLIYTEPDGKFSFTTYGKNKLEEMELN
jgi:hypothetical protein